jgi:hypothetical protein
MIEMYVVQKILDSKTTNFFKNTTISNYTRESVKLTLSRICFILRE